MTNYIEHIDKKRVEQLLKKDDLSDDVKKQLKSYLKKYDYKKGGFVVEYEHKGIGRGRKYAKILCLYRTLRKTFVKHCYMTHTPTSIL